MLALSYFVVGIGFPLGVLLARHRGRRSVWLITATAMALVVLLALFLASSWGGNRLVATEGYGTVASGVLRLAGLTLLWPILVAACTASLLGERTSAAYAYPLTVGLTLIAMFIGLMGSIWLR